LEKNITDILAPTLFNDDGMGGSHTDSPVTLGEYGVHYSMETLAIAEESMKGHS